MYWSYRLSPHIVGEGESLHQRAILPTGKCLDKKTHYISHKGYIFIWECTFFRYYSIAFITLSVLHIYEIEWFRNVLKIMIFFSLRFAPACYKITQYMFLHTSFSFKVDFLAWKYLLLFFVILYVHDEREFG